ncbi:MAG: hypothetical protein ACTSPY_09300 [Candidatus Helarchaeota archaeon]
MIKISEISDKKKFKILQRDLLLGLKYARTLDEIIMLLERKIREITD